MEDYVDLSYLPPVESFHGNMVTDGDEYVRCSRCGYGGCDIRVTCCGCTLHARCTLLSQNGPLQRCTQCDKPSTNLVLFPMSFREIDEAHRIAQLGGDMSSSVATAPGSLNRGRKRKGTETGAEVVNVHLSLSERRTGRWTNEEMTYCDTLIAKFSEGELPLPDGVKLNEFLGNMLKSKQSRLTKKMKNAKLSTKTFQRTTGCLNSGDAVEFAALEESFFLSISDVVERAEVKFHMQREWREQFSRVCAVMGQTLDADLWLSSVEEMDRRAAKARDAACMTKRRLMMGAALRTDTNNLQHGVFIEKSENSLRSFGNLDGIGIDEKDFENEMLLMLGEEKNIGLAFDTNEQSSLLHSAPFLAKVTSHLTRHAVPFEHVDLWVPSFVAGEGAQDGDTACRLCYAGNSTTERLTTDDGATTRPLSKDEKFNFFSFGDYSQKFSFAVGCGLPGRVYESGRPTWEQSVQNAPSHHFERCGGAEQWGIKTVVGIPVASPNVGRIVVVLYSCHDRSKDDDLVTRLSEEFTRLMPSPKWKLVVDIGEVEESNSMETVASDPTVITKVDVDTVSTTNVRTTSFDASRSIDERIDEVVSILGKYMPSDPCSPFAPFVSGFMSLRLLLLRLNRSLEEDELVRTMVDSYTSYALGGRDQSDIAFMLARDFMFLSQQQQQVQSNNLFLDNAQSFSLSATNAPADSTNLNSGLSLFGLPSTRSSLENSPAMAPIPAPRSVDSLSIVSN